MPVVSPETESIRTSAFPPPLCPIPATAQRLKARWYASCHKCHLGIYAGTIMIWQAAKGHSWHEQCFAERPARTRSLKAVATIAANKGMKAGVKPEPAV